MPDKRTKLFPGTLWGPSSDSETGAKRFEHPGSSMRRFYNFVLGDFLLERQDKWVYSYNEVISGSIFNLTTKFVDFKYV